MGADTDVSTGKGTGAVDARQERGRLLARNKRIKLVGDSTWLVPSQSQNAGGYMVNVAGGTRSCPDYELRRTKCKHQWAVELTRTVETAPDGTRVLTETMTVTRRTYAQDWPNYNAAQCAEKRTVQAIFRGLCDGILPRRTPGRGPEPIPLSDAAYGMTMKGASVDAVLAGRSVPAGTCPHCGHPPDEAAQ